MPGRANNDPIERRFSLARCLAGCFSALDVTACCQAKRTLLLRLVAEACRNNNGSHSKPSFKAFFNKATALTNILETASTNQFIQNYRNAINLDFNLKNKILSDKHLPCIAGHGLKKFLDRKPTSCLTCLNKMTHGRNILMSATSTIGCNTTFIAIRDEGGLVWPTIHIVHICGIAIEIFQHLLSNENLCASFIENSACARSGLMEIKHICDGAIKNCLWIPRIKIQHPSCKRNLFNDISKSLIRACFNIGANNFARLLNKRVLAKHVTLKMVKDLKAKGRRIKNSNSNLRDKEMSSWKIADCKSHSKSNNLASTGNLAVLKIRCYLMEDLSNAEMACSMTLPIKDLKSMRASFDIECSTRDKMA